MNNEYVLECSDLKKSFGSSNLFVEVLKGINLKIADGKTLAVIGTSGSGKSTLLHLLGGLDDPDSGSISICGSEISNLNAENLSTMRNINIGFVYQFHYLLPEFSALENVAMPLLIQGVSVKNAIEQSTELLDKIGLQAREHHKPSELSGGERQRVAICRAIITKPSIVLADEPTGNLDAENAEHIAALITTLNHDYGISFLVATHDTELASSLDQTKRLEEGVLI
jgi:lipoprotein-releasing system ATP-binding protein